jgi:hypothetical protein
MELNVYGIVFVRNCIGMGSLNSMYGMCTRRF